MTMSRPNHQPAQIATTLRPSALLYSIAAEHNTLCTHTHFLFMLLFYWTIVSRVDTWTRLNYSSSFYCSCCERLLKRSLDHFATLTLDLDACKWSFINNSKANNHFSSSLANNHNPLPFPIFLWAVDVGETRLAAEGATKLKDLLPC